MADINLKTETPDTSLPTTGFLFGADSQAASAPSVFTVQSVATTLLGSTTLSGATITADAPVLNMSQTWNNGAVTFTGLKYNVVSDTSAAASLLMDLQVGGTSRARLIKDGTLQLGGATSELQCLGVVLNNGTIGNTAWGVYLAGNSGDMTMRNTGSLAWTSGVATGTKDLLLTRRAAANLRFGAADVGATTATVTITIAAPGVVTWSSHTLSTGTPVVFTTTGALPTGITASTTYYAVVVNDNTFQIASSVANAIAATPTVITTSGTQSGTHTGTRYNITQRLSMQSVTGVTDRLGADLFIQGSQGTGTGAGGSIIFQVAPAGGTSNGVQNGLATTAQFGPFQGKLYLGSASPTSSNYAIWGDGTNTWVNAPTSGGYVHFGSLDNWGVAVHPASVRISSNFTLGWTASNPGAALDTILARDAANTLALRNGANAQIFRVYNTFTDASNYERLNIGYDSNICYVETSGAGTGTQRNLTVGGAIIDFRTGANSRWNINGSGHFITALDNTYDIGALSATRPRNVYVGTAVEGASGAYFGWNARAALYSDATNNIRLSGWGASINLLQFGGTTSSFPALKRSTTTLQAVLANDGGFTNIQGKLTTETAYTAGSIVPTGYLTLYDSTGTAYRVPCVV